MSAAISCEERLERRGSRGRGPGYGIVRIRAQPDAGVRAAGAAPARDQGRNRGHHRARHTNLEQFLSLRSLNFHHPKLIVLLCDARWEGEGVMRANTPTGTLTASALVL